MCTSVRLCCTICGEDISFILQGIGRLNAKQVVVEVEDFKVCDRKLEFRLTELSLSLYDVRADVLFYMIKVQCERI